MCEMKRLAGRTLLTIQPITRPAAIALTIAHDATPMNRSNPNAANAASEALTQNASHKSPTSSVSETSSSAILINIRAESNLVNVRLGP